MECVHRRGGVYNVIINVPVKFQTLLGKRQIWRSLKTKNYAVARTQARKLIFAAEQLFIKLRTDMDSRIINAMVAEYGLTTLAEHDKARIGAKASQNSTRNNALADFYTLAQSTDKNQAFVSDAMSSIGAEYQKLIGRGKHAELPLVDELAKLYMARFMVNGFIDDNLDADSDEFNEIVAAFATAEKLIHKIVAERLQGITVDESEFQHRVIKRWNENLPAKKDVGRPITDVFKLYLSDWETTHEPPRIKRKSDELKRLERSFTECFGNVIGIKELTSEKVLEWLPYLQHEFTGETLANKTVKNYVETMASVYKFAIKQKFTDDNKPFAELKIPTGDKSENSRIFTDTELQKYINYVTEFHNPKYPERTYIPLIMMYSGMRCNEIAQLYTDDIQEQDGVLFFRVTNDKTRNQHLKCDNSKRNVPIHTALIELGLLKHVAKMNEHGPAQIFPNCVYRPNDGLHYDSNISTTLNLPINLIDPDPKLRLYSLRANFRNNIEEKFVDDAVRSLENGGTAISSGYKHFFDLALNNVMGHAIRGTTGDKIYRKKQLHIMNTVVQLAEYKTELNPLIKILSTD